MTTARLDRSALALDAGAAHGAWDALGALMRKVSAYVSGIQEMPLEPVPVFGTTIDAFHQLPGLKQALATARSHAPAWQGVGMDLYVSVLMGASEFGPQLSARSAEIKGIVDGAAAAKRPLSAAERASIVAILRTLEASLQSRRGTLEKLKPRVVDFIRLITGDYATLTSGGERIDEAIPAVERATTEAALKFMSPESQGLMRMVLEAGAKIRNTLVALSASVHRLATANDDAQRALQSVLTMWTTVEGKFKSVITTLSEAEQAVGVFEDLPLLLEIAADSWREFLEYMKT
jgi:hypothetical protein